MAAQCMWAAVLGTGMQPLHHCEGPVQQRLQLGRMQLTVAMAVGAALLWHTNALLLACVRREAEMERASFGANEAQAHLTLLAEENRQLAAAAQVRSPASWQHTALIAITSRASGGKPLLRHACN